MQKYKVFGLQGQSLCTNKECPLIAASRLIISTGEGTISFGLSKSEIGSCGLFTHFHRFILLFIYVFLQDFINENVITDFQEDFVVDLDKKNNERSVSLFFIRPELSVRITAFTSDKTSRLMVHVHCPTPVPVPRPLLIKCVQN